MKRTTTYAATILLLGLPLAAAANDSATVEVGHNRLEPAEVEIHAGGSVTFHNQDQMPGGHTLVADDGSFESPPLDKDQKWSKTFEEPGTYTYHIEEHPEAEGTIVVESEEHEHDETDGHDDTDDDM